MEAEAKEKDEDKDKDEDEDRGQFTRSTTMRMRNLGTDVWMI